MKKTQLSLLFIFLCSMHVFSQEKTSSQEKIISEKEIIQKGVDLFEQKKYKESILEYSKISKYSPSYNSALYEKALSYSALKMIDSAIEVLEPNQTNFKGSDAYRNYILLANLYDDNKNIEKAKSAYLEAIKRYPNSFEAYFDYSIHLFNQKNYRECYANLQKSIALNPSYPKTHLLLGNVASKEGAITQALLAYTMSIYVDPGTNRSLNTLQIVDKMVAEKQTDLEDNQIFTTDKGLEEIENMIRSQVALQKDYKMKDISFNYPVIKQLHLLFSDIENLKSEDSFIDKTYMTFFREIKSRNHFKSFTTVLLASLNNKEVEKEFKKNEEPINELLKWSKANFTKIVFNRAKTIEGKMYQMNCTQIEDHFVYCTENKTEEDQEKMSAYYYPNGQLKSYGLELKDLKKGTWTYFSEEGKKESVLFFEDNLKNGPYTIYFENGLVKEEGEFLKDSSQGKLKRYNIYGVLITEAEFDNNKKTGEWKYYYNNGYLKKTMSFKEDLLDGERITYYDDGKSIQAKEHFLKGDQTGTYEKFHPNGVLESKYSIENGEIEGDFEKFDLNQVLINKTNYKNGVVQSEIDYSQNGIINEENFYEKGSLTTTKQYDYEGNLSNVINYNKDGVVTKIVNYKNNQPVGEEKVGKNGKINLKWFYTDVPLLEGEYAKGKLQGNLKYYYINGNLKSENDYQKNESSGWKKFYSIEGFKEREYEVQNEISHGQYISYYPNGNIFEKGTYYNGELYGEWTTYYIDGTLNKISYYLEEGELSYQASYTPDGILEEKSTYLEKCCIDRKLYDTTGVNYYTLTFKKGEQVDNRISSFNYFQYSVPMINGFYQGKSSTYSIQGIQNSYNEFDNGSRNGHCIFYYPNGTKNRSSMYRMGELDGIDTIFYINGVIEELSEYKDGKLYGENIRFYPNGAVRRKAIFKNDQFDGTVDYYGYNGELVLRKFFRNDYLLYLIKNNANGELVDTVDTRKNNSMEIIATYKNGKTALIQTLKKGNYAKEFKLFKEDGTLLEHDEYSDASNLIFKKIYYDNGQLFFEKNYMEHKEHGPAVYKTTDGKMILEEEYKNDELHGLVKIYQADGTLQNILKYNDNVVVEKIK